MIYITTFSGIHFTPLNPDINQIEIEDIAHSLSNICRANGHVRYFYSVAQHSIACCKEAEKRGYNKKVQLGCLLHDASEAYLNDLIRPLKNSFSEYLQYEKKLQELIWSKYLKGILSTSENEKIFLIDDHMLAYEFKLLMNESLSDEYKNIISRPDMNYKNPHEVKKEFLQLFYKLFSL